MNLEEKHSPVENQNPNTEPAELEHDPLAGSAGLRLHLQPESEPLDSTPAPEPAELEHDPLAGSAGLWLHPQPEPEPLVSSPAPEPVKPEPLSTFERQRLALDKLTDSKQRLLAELRKVIIGQDQIIEELMIVLFAGGHCLISGAPGLAKTLLIRTLAQILDLQFRRVQFTPDLMPSDLTGTEIIDENKITGHRELRFIQGPVFTQVLLADEINRTPPKTQAALLEAMEEKQVTVAGISSPLPKPFFVFATQNPIELEGTYPLPEAQMDRFMFQLLIKYLSEDEELAVANQTTSGASQTVVPIFSAEDLITFAELVRQVPIADAVARYAVRIAQRTRPEHPDAPDFIKKWVSWGAGTRATQYLILGGKARALLKGRLHVACEDIRAVAPATLRHRILTNFQADAEHIGPDTIISRLIATVEEPKSGL